jgi:hypothetical protein
VRLAAGVAHAPFLRCLALATMHVCLNELHDPSLNFYSNDLINVKIPSFRRMERTTSTRRVHTEHDLHMPST